VSTALQSGDDRADENGDRRPRRVRRPRPSIHDGPPSVLYTVKQVELAARHHLDELLKPSGVTALQYTALTVLQRRDGFTVTELAQNSFVKVQSMADLLRPLYERQLISRRADPAHGRRQLIGLTASGRDLIDVYDRRVRNLEERMLAPLSEDEAEMLLGLLARCRTALA
jgi:DNA-binding MarR family transcriptional regulator